MTLRNLILSLTFLLWIGLSGIFAQSQIQTLIEKLNVHKKNILQEKIFVHTDRTFYLTGETLWLKLYYVDANYHRPISLSKVAYVQILDKDNKSVLETKITLNTGVGDGSLFLPASLNSGHYILRAYTNWMKNFDQDYYFQQSLTIVNPFTKLGLKPLTKLTNYDVQFFPEGGNLVNGLESVVGFRAVDQNGKGINFKGTIVNEASDTIVTFRPLKFGIGRFSFTPDISHKYHAVIINHEGKHFIYKLPLVQENGYVLKLKDTLNSKIVVVVRAKLPSGLSDPTMHLVVHTRLKNIKDVSGFMQNGKVEFMLDKQDVSDGISHITIFDSNSVPLCERLYFKEPVDQLKIDLTLGQAQYSTRKKVDLNVSTLTNDGLAESDISISVYRLDSLVNNNNNIASYLLLASDLKGNIESPEYYLRENSDEKKAIAIDNLMLTHGWSRFKWDDIIKPTKAFDYLPECNGHIINALVSNTETSNPAERIITYLSSPGKIIRLYVSKSNAKGIARFEVENFYGTHEIIVQTNTQLDSLYGIKILNPFSEKKSTFTLPEFDLPLTLRRDLQQRSIHMQAQNIFYEKESNQYKSLPIDSSAFYGKADVKYRLDDYTRFPTMEEVMREYVPGVAVRKRRSGFHFMNFDEINMLFFKEDPLVILDGLPIFDINKIMAFDPHKVKTLDVMTHRYYLGPSSFDGVVSYSTYKGDLAGFQPDPTSLRTNYEGLQLHREFFSPRYETQEQRASVLPDARNLLYWSPSGQTNEQGKRLINFYTSDITGKYEIVVQGITKDGKAGYSSTTFEVKDKLNY